MFVEKYEEGKGHWVAVAGPNPRIKDNLQWAAWAREKGTPEDIERAEKYEKEAADIASGEALKGITHRWDFDWKAPKVYEGWLYSGRNYNLFAILANVRNGRGFAGVETGAGFNPIDSPRGLPEDYSDEVQDYLGEGDYHSISYIYLRELIEYDWNQTTTLYGTVGQEGYREWKEKGSPSSYSGGVSGQMVVHITNDEMEALVNGEYPVEEGKSYYTRVSWQVSYSDVAGSFYPDAIKELKELSENTEGEDVRIVFGFDS